MKKPVKKAAAPAVKKGASAPNKEVTTKKSQAVVPAKGLQKYAGVPTGLEQVSSQDLIIPRIAILQPLSPQLQRSKPEYIKDARAGDFCDTGVGDIIRDQMDFVCCKFARIYLEWKPNRGGLFMNHGTDVSCLDDCETDDETRQKIKPNGNFIAETMTFFLLNLSLNRRKNFIGLTSTQLKPARQLVTKMSHEELKINEKTFPAPCYYRSWTATPVERSNEKGTWHGWAFAAGDPIDEIDPSGKLFEQAREFNDMATRGLVQGDFGGMAEEAGGEESAGDGDM